MRSSATLFTPDGTRNRPSADEVKCYFLHDCLLKVVDAFDEEHDKNVPNRFSQFLKQFERALIINTRTNAVQMGEAYLVASIQGLCRILPTEKSKTILHSLGIAKPEDSIPFSSHYISTEHYLQGLINSTYQPAEHEQSEVIISLAKCKSFSLLQNLLDKIPQAAIETLKNALESAFFYSVHFGDENMMQYLLRRGVSPHAIHCPTADKKQMPLMLLICDLNRCVQRMQKRVQHAFSGKLISGTLQDLERVFAARLHAYDVMITTLLQHGANPDQAPDATFSHAETPRAKAQFLLGTSIPALRDSQFHFKDKANEIAELLQLITVPSLAEDADNDLQPVEKRLKM